MQHVIDICRHFFRLCLLHRSERHFSYFRQTISAINYCQFYKLFLILQCYQINSRHIESVFRSLNLKMWKFSKLRDERIALISCIAMRLGTVQCIHPILFKCGALYRLSQLGPSTTFRLINENQLHTFFFINQPYWSCMVMC